MFPINQKTPSVQHPLAASGQWWGAEQKQEGCVWDGKVTTGEEQRTGRMTAGILWSRAEMRRQGGKAIETDSDKWREGERRRE